MQQRLQLADCLTPPLARTATSTPDAEDPAAEDAAEDQRTDHSPQKGRQLACQSRIAWGPGLVSVRIAWGPGLVSVRIAWGPGLVSVRITKGPGLVSVRITKGPGLVQAAVLVGCITARAHTTVGVEHSKRREEGSVPGRHRLRCGGRRGQRGWRRRTGGGGRRANGISHDCERIVTVEIAAWDANTCPTVIAWGPGMVGQHEGHMGPMADGSHRGMEAAWATVLPPSTTMIPSHTTDHS